MTFPSIALRFSTRCGTLLPLGLLGALTSQGQRIVADPGGESCRVMPDCKGCKYEFRPDPG